MPGPAWLMSVASRALVIRRHSPLVPRDALPIWASLQILSGHLPGPS